MKLQESSIKIKCDMPNCKQMAKFKLQKSGFMKNAGLFLCKDCVKEIYEALASNIVPKSPSNMLNKKITKKEKEI